MTFLPDTNWRIQQLNLFYNQLLANLHYFGKLCCLFRFQVFRSIGSWTLESEGSNKLFLLKNGFI